jgi:hypothetical protein
MAKLAPPQTGLELARAIFASPRLTAALTTTIIGTAVFSFALHQLIAWPGFIAVLAALLILAILSLIAQWRAIGWNGLLPISLLGFLGWAGASIFWSQYHWATLGGLAYLGVYTVLGVYVALARDTIQVVRAFGDVLRFALALSLGIEVFSGILIDTPIHFLGITGRIATFGPITGLMNTTDELGIVAVVALVTFGTELQTRSVSRGTGIVSIILGALALLLSRAPLAIGATIIVAIAIGVLAGLRQASARARPFLQIVVLLLIVAVGVAAWGNRGVIVRTFNATGALNYRLRVWQGVWDLTQLRSLQGWGWIGAWRLDTLPFTTFAAGDRTFPDSALNAYLDVWFQVGLVGLLIFLGFLGLAFTRSWLLASRRRSVVFTWPSLVLVVLVISGLAESSMLVEFGWLTLVVCSVKAARDLSWRVAFSDIGDAAAPE